MNGGHDAPPSASGPECGGSHATEASESRAIQLMLHSTSGTNAIDFHSGTAYLSSSTEHRFCVFLSKSNIPRQSPLPACTDVGISGSVPSLPGRLPSRRPFSGR